MFIIPKSAKRLLFAGLTFVLADLLLLWSQSSGIRRPVTEFVDAPLIYVQVLFLSIWLAVGRHQIVVRLSIALLCFMGLFFLLSVEWFTADFLLVGRGQTWNQYQWIGFLGASTVATIFFGLPVVLLAMALPLTVYRCQREPKSDLPASRLELRDLFVAMSCVCVTSVIVVGAPPYPSWLLELPIQVSRYVSNATSFVAIVLLPSINYATVAYASIACSTTNGKSILLAIVIALGVSFIAALVYMCTASAIVQDMGLSLSDVVYQSGQNVLTVLMLATTLLLMNCPWR